MGDPWPHLTAFESWQNTWLLWFEGFGWREVLYVWVLWTAVLIAHRVWKDIHGEK